MLCRFRLGAVWLSVLGTHVLKAASPNPFLGDRFSEPLPRSRFFESALLLPRCTKLTGYLWDIFPGRSLRLFMFFEPAERECARRPLQEIVVWIVLWIVLWNCSLVVVARKPVFAKMELKVQLKVELKVQLSFQKTYAGSKLPSKFRSDSCSKFGLGSGRNLVEVALRWVFLLLPLFPLL